MLQAHKRHRKLYMLDHHCEHFNRLAWLVQFCTFCLASHDITKSKFCFAFYLLPRCAVLFVLPLFCRSHFCRSFVGRRLFWRACFLFVCCSVSVVFGSVGLLRTVRVLRAHTNGVNVAQSIELPAESGRVVAAAKVVLAPQTKRNSQPI